MSRALKSTEPAVPDSDDSPSSLSLDNMEFEQLPEGLGEAEAFEDQPEENEPAARPTQDFFDESNPFYAKPKGLPTPAKAEKKGVQRRRSRYPEEDDGASEGSKSRRLADGAGRVPTTPGCPASGIFRVATATRGDH